jgi:hypothetical protein
LFSKRLPSNTQSRNTQYLQAKRNMQCRISLRFGLECARSQHCALNAAGSVDRQPLDFSRITTLD